METVVTHRRVPQKLKPEKEQEVTKLQEAPSETVVTHRRVPQKLKPEKKEKNPVAIGKFYCCVSLLRPR